VLKQLDTFIATRFLVPWLPLFVLWMARGAFVSPTTEALGAMTLILAARLLAEPTFPHSAISRLIFCGLPIIGGALIFAGQADVRLDEAWVFYGIAATGTVLVAISDLRERV
jgi:hypothetical protein